MYTENKPVVSVIVLNLNGMEYLKGCITSLFKQTFDSFEIILVDNGSSDGSVEYVRKNYPTVRLIENKTNLGFAAGNNQGIRVAAGKYIATLNNDTEVDSNWLKSLVEVAESDALIGMCASRILSFSNPGIIDSVGILIYPDGMSRGRGRLEEDRGQYDRVEEVFFPSACAALYRKRMLDQIGIFDEDFFAYCEDTDLGLRGRLSGWKAVFVPTARVYHHYSGTGGKYSSFKAFLVERNHIWVAVKVFPVPRLLTLPLYTLWRFLVIFYGLKQNKGAVTLLMQKESIFKVIWIVFHAYGSALKNLPATWRKRKAIQKTRRISCSEFSKLMRLNGLRASELMLKD